MTVRCRILVSAMALAGVAVCSDAPSLRQETARVSAADLARADADVELAAADTPVSERRPRKFIPAGNADHDSLKYAAEMNLRARLKDADAAKYRNVVLSQIEGGNLMLCGQVSSKNSFGGFTGFKRFIASPNPDAPTLVEGETSGLGAAVDASFPQAYGVVCSNPVEKY